MMTLNPIELTKNIKKNYIQFLTSSLRFRDDEFRELFYKETEKFDYTNGPILEATPPFKKGCYFQFLVDNHIVNTHFKDFIYNVLPFLGEKKLFLHQEKAIRKVINGRNVVITAGTGSGKTEAFLIPIYNHLLNEFDKGTLNPGVRALLLYPMNALANDQIRRLREIAEVMEEKTPNIRITFGRYIGETPEKKSDGLDKFRKEHPGLKPGESELLSREEMRENPPHILITNYAMLEYLLLRPKDSPFFEGTFSGNWKFLVLDEAHSYSGSKGIEIGMLIRRLKDRICEGKVGEIQCIATSATLVSEKNNEVKVVDFAKKLVGENFEWDPKDNNKNDIIYGETEELKKKDSTFEAPLNLFDDLCIIRNKNLPPEITTNKFKNLCEKIVPSSILEEISSKTTNIPRKFLYLLFLNESNILKLKNKLEKKPLNLEDVPKILGINSVNSDIYNSLISMIDLAAWAKFDSKSTSLIPARYHLFIRAPEGVYISYFPKKKLYLQPHKSTPEGFPVFEIATCRRCGQEYIKGIIEDGKIISINRYILSFTEKKKKKKESYFMIEDKFLEQEIEFEENEDENVLIPKISYKKGITWTMCTECGLIWKIGTESNCQCNKGNKNRITLYEIVPTENTLNKCIQCGLSSINIVREFYFQKDAPAAVLARSLFELLKDKPNNQKKILAFSDSRQDAAFFASYLQFHYERLLHRRLIYKAIERNSDLDDYRLEDICDDVYKIAKKYEFFDNKLGRKKIIENIWGWVLVEFIALDQRNSLEGVGNLSFQPIFPKDWIPIPELLKDPWNLTIDEAKSLYIMMLNSIRIKQAISFPEDGPPPEDEIFARFQRNREFFFRGSKSDRKKSIYSFTPSISYQNARLEILFKLLRHLTQKDLEKEDKLKCNILLGKIWDDLVKNWVDKGLVSKQLRTQGICFQLDYQLWKVIPTLTLDDYFYCNKCGKITLLNLKGICSTYRCEGHLIPLDSSPNKLKEIERNHFRNIYTNMPISQMVVQEHTAQLKPQYATEVQQKFIDGKINILSCSTTFEMGVDLGELELIFLKNVPPEPSNYIQRAGRAGRRADSIGFTLTFALPRSHDLSYFKDPIKMVAGQVQPPLINIKNEKIVQRHLNSLVMADFFRKNPDFFGTTNNFFMLEDESMSARIQLENYLKKHPDNILISLKRTIPKILHNKLKLDNWGWIESLLNIDNGALTIADNKIQGEYLDLTEYEATKRKNIQNLANGGTSRQIYINNRDLEWAERRKRTLENTRLLSYLASNNVIPKYGFPVDVVDLTPLSHFKAAKNIRLERDLRLAISEFAPSSQVVANGFLWKSSALRRIRNKEWDIRWYAICGECKRLILSKEKLKERPKEIKCLGCNKLIKPYFIRRFLIPKFGFLTSKEEKPRKVEESRPKRQFSSRPYFSTYFDADKKSFILKNLEIDCSYSSQGELVVICDGKDHKGFYFCLSCGTGFANLKDFQKKEFHVTPYGSECRGVISGPFNLGHTFYSDVLAISIKRFNFDSKLMDYSFWLSLLFAIIEGASLTLGIQRRDLDGCIYQHENNYNLVIFDNVPGGAGHVEQIFKEENFKKILENVLILLQNCSCGRETSCNSCLRNYSNQYFHPLLQRGIVIDFLMKNL